MMLQRKIMSKKLARPTRDLTDEEERDILVDEVKKLRTSEEEFLFIEKTCQDKGWPLEVNKKQLVVRVTVDKPLRESLFVGLRFWTVWYITSF